MSDIWLTEAQIKQYQDIDYPDDKGKTHSAIDGTPIKLYGMFHSMTSNILFTQWGDSSKLPSFYNRDHIKEWDKDDLSECANDLRRIDFYITEHYMKLVVEPTPIPKHIIKKKLTDVYQWMDEKDPLGQYYRTLITRVLEEFGLTSPEQGRFRPDRTFPSDDGVSGP